MQAYAPAVTTTPVVTPHDRRSSGYSNPRKNNSSSSGASVTPNATIRYAPVASLKNLSTGSDLGIGIHREANSTTAAKMIPERKKPRAAGPGQFQRIAVQKLSSDLPRTSAIMKTITMGYAASCDPMTTMGFVARSPTDA